MLIFLKNIVLFFFGNLLNGMIFAEREREREIRNDRLSKNCRNITCRVLACPYLNKGVYPLAVYHSRSIAIKQCRGSFFNI